MDCCLPGSSVHGDSPGKNTGVDCHALLQGIFLTQGSNPDLCIAGGFFASWATREAQALSKNNQEKKKKGTITNQMNVKGDITRDPPNI